MCAEFMITAKLKALARSIGVPISSIIESIDSARRILPRGTAPVLHSPAGEPLFAPMQFSLIPSWSKTPTVKFATFNARLDTITEKATWKKPFLLQRAVVPMTGFIEPSYEGALAGGMVRFEPQDPEEVLLAAALYDRWIDPETKSELLSFAIITNLPSPVVASIGHDRQPVFLKADSLRNWLDPAVRTNDAVKQTLNEATLQPNLTATTDRLMKAGWEKRKASSK